MSQLERAATALRERPPTPPPPLEGIEHRAGTLRRRRRLLDAGAIALVLLVLGTVGLALGAAGGHDDDQGVFVGEGPVSMPTVTTANYRLSSPLDPATAQALQLTLESRFGYFGQGQATVQISGTDVTVTTSTPADRIDSLVTAPGGFELRRLIGDASEASCRSAGGGYGEPQAMWTSALTGPPRCLSVGSPVSLPAHPSPYSTGGDSLDGKSYRFEVVLTPIASQALVDASSPCAEPVCLPATIAVTTDRAIVDPEAQVTQSTSDTGIEVRIVMPALSGLADGQVMASVLVHPLPDGVTLTRVITDDASAAPAESSRTDAPNATDSTGTTAGSPFPSDLLPVTRTVCVSAPVDEAVLADLAQAVGARFAALGRTVQMRTRTPRTANFDVSCTSGQAILLSSDYDPGDPDWLGDQIALLAPGVMRAVDGTVLHPEDVTSTVYRSMPEAQALAVTLPASDYAHLRTLKLYCSNSDPCWLSFTIDGTAVGTVVADGATSVSGRTMLVSLPPGSEQQAGRLAAVLANPLPEDVTLEV